ncbi:type II toxin-antitoxin system mRNA interferase toxin, RelE/StbE family [Methylococcaceae bacterium HT5]|nr:type II toxin-antitoxin system mRNA interferase toxin, RelE/StbE family [Methylococcaceae bacterium HT5]
MLELVWLGSAEADLDNIAEYIAQDNIDAAIDVYLRIKDSSKGLLEHPKIGRAGKVKGTRERVVVGPKLIIVYRVVARIEIIRVLHGAQMWPSPESAKDI